MKVFIIGFLIVVFVIGDWVASPYVFAQTYSTPNPKNYTGIFHNESQYILCEGSQYSYFICSA